MNELALAIQRKGRTLRVYAPCRMLAQKDQVIINSGLVPSESAGSKTASFAACFTAWFLTRRIESGLD